MCAKSESLDFARDGADWPNREASRFIEAGGLNWHVQVMGQGPDLLLLHGTGGASHSWRALAPLLAQHFRVVAPDLPGHGFTTARRAPDLSLPGMATSIAALIGRLGPKPEVVVGHSAGAAILTRLCLDGAISPRLFVSLNGAFLPFEGLAGMTFPVLAKMLFLNPFAPRLFAWAADHTAVANLLLGTGSKIEPRGVELYTRLMRNPAHCAGALAMMANWSLESLAGDLKHLAVPAVLIVGNADKAVPPANAAKVAALIPQASVERLPGLGHLAHEENSERVARLIVAYAARAGVIAAP